jgi:hypothetical protein
MKLLTYTPPELRPAPLRTMKELTTRPKRRSTRKPNRRAEKREVQTVLLADLNNCLASRVLSNGRFAIALGVDANQCSWIVMEPDTARDWLQSSLEQLGGSPA